jgi:hypothetical protein
VCLEQSTRCSLGETVATVKTEGKLAPVGNCFRRTIPERRHTVGDRRKLAGAFLRRKLAGAFLRRKLEDHRTVAVASLLRKVGDCRKPVEAFLRRKLEDHRTVAGAFLRRKLAEERHKGGDCRKPVEAALVQQRVVVVRRKPAEERRKPAEAALEERVASVMAPEFESSQWETWTLFATTGSDE